MSLFLSGSFHANHLIKLLMLVQSAQGMGLRVTLHLARLKSADQEAVRGILSWRDHGVQIRQCPEYVQEWLRREAPARESSVNAAAVIDGARSAIAKAENPFSDARTLGNSSVACCER